MNMQTDVSRTNAARGPVGTTKKRDQILQMAGRLVREFGHAEWPISELTNRTGIAKGTLYLYFDSRRDLMQALFLREVSGWAVMCTGLVTTAPNRTELVKSIWQAAMDRPVLIGLAGHVPTAPGPLPSEALGYFATQISIRFGLRQAVAMQSSWALVAALVGALSVGVDQRKAGHALETGAEMFRTLATGILPDD